MSKFELTRRGLIKSGAAVGAGLAMPTLITNSANAYTNEPKGGTVTLGFNVPQSGPYADEGADELRAYELAVEHLNGGGDGGMMGTFSSKALKGNGILGKKVEFVTGDTQTKADAARASAKSMIEKDGAVMITGGSSSGVAVAVQALCYNWGYTTEEAVKSSTEAMGWETVNSVKTPLTQTDFSSYIAPVLQSGADVLVLNHYGGNMVNSLTNAVQFGLRDKQVNGKQFEIVVPLYSRLMARGAGENVKGIYGSTNWHWSLSDEGSKAFVKSFGEKYGFPPSQAAHTVYCQTLLYADAAERAGTFNPCGIVEALEGFEFDGLGNGKTLYRAEDHQCFKDVLVVKGKENPTSEFDVLEVVEVTPVDQVTYAPDHPQMRDANGNAVPIGTCNAGA